MAFQTEVWLACLFWVERSQFASNIAQMTNVKCKIWNEITVEFMFNALCIAK